MSAISIRILTTKHYTFPNIFWKNPEDTISSIKPANNGPSKQITLPSNAHKRIVTGIAGHMNQDSISRDEIREYLNPIYDLERLLSKVTYKTANPRDLIAFRNSLQMLPPIKTVLSAFEKEELTKIREQIDGLEDIYQLIDEAIIDEPPLSIREGGMIKDQFDETIDRLRSAKHDGKQWLAQLEEEDRERTGIKNLKILCKRYHADS